ncbi:hypothetical protein BN2497_5697 [Janthinobacterium sp. CG23_2]|nr:hypothetical protein BN2497_5697 [Janthinobacterium sp. CG23_2]CUU29246.1 hypothetical protein BN3177_5697 [Janthinobacterium sp. CG23_2]
MWHRLLSDTVAPSFELWLPMNPSACPAARLLEVDRKEMAILGRGSKTVLLG